MGLVIFVAILACCKLCEIKYGVSWLRFVGFPSLLFSECRCAAASHTLCCASKSVRSHSIARSTNAPKVVIQVSHQSLFVYCIVLHCNVLYCIVSYYHLLYCIVLYCIVCFIHYCSIYSQLEAGKAVVYSALFNP